MSKRCFAKSDIGHGCGGFAKRPPSREYNAHRQPGNFRFKMLSLLQQITLFIAVGCGASAIHWAVAVSCVKRWDASPLAANLMGWLVAFVLSFGGHQRLTFRHSITPWPMAARRFLLISTAGIALNSCAYAWLLRTTSIPYDALLAMVMLGVAVATFISSRLWAFRHAAALHR
jgi:putative flippase GtrA